MSSWAEVTAFRLMVTLPETARFGYKKAALSWAAWDFFDSRQIIAAGITMHFRTIDRSPVRSAEDSGSNR